MNIKVQKQWADMFDEAVYTNENWDILFKKHEVANDLEERYSEAYYAAIRACYWAHKIGKCNTGSIRNPNDVELAEYCGITVNKLYEIIDSEKI